MSVLNKLSILFLTLTWCGCASVTPPSGGPKDEVAPKLKSVVPANKSLNYKGRIIAMEFDEEVEVRDLQKELIITPYTDNTYETKVKKNRITIEFKDSLKDSTTYTFNFRNAVRDLTESNAAVIPPFIFSTGSYLDSGSVAGSVVRHLTDNPEADIDILLYKAADTATVRNSKPVYVTRTDASGKFSFNNLTTGVYKIYALTDKNNTLTYDQDIERIGYRTDSVIITASTDSVKLRTIRIDTKKPYILKRNIKADKADLEYNEGLTELKIQNQSEADSVFTSIDKTGKIVRIYRLPEQKEARFIALATDSAGFQSTDTVTINFNLPYKTTTPKLSLASEQQYIPGTEIILISQVPVKTINENAFSIAFDSVQKFTVSTAAIRLEKNVQKIIIPPVQLPKDILQFTLSSDSTSVTAVTGQLLAPFDQTFGIAEATNSGSLKGRVVSAYSNYFLQLLDKDYKVIEERKNEANFIFKNLKPGTYRLRLLIDNNQNGQWDTGNADLTQIPEDVFNYPSEIEIRANWDLEDIIFSTEITVDKRASVGKE